MILIGTSGSTKCDWQLVDANKTLVRKSTKGMNPFFMDDVAISDIAKSLGSDILDRKSEIEVVYYFGAGCSSKHFASMVERGLSMVFNKSHLYVKEDIVAAAFATFNGEPSITALMGTGSNACHFDGDIVRQEVSGMDFILGDEGSRSHFGKMLLSKFLKKQLPPEIARDLEQEFRIDKEEILLNVYIKPYANVYLSSFSQFIKERIDHPYLKAMVKQSITEFVETYICSIKNYENLPVHFVGSVPHFFEEVVNEVLEEHQLIKGIFVEEPIDLLVSYLIKKHYKN
ncbi:ATPase [Marivirga tractuosa]|uniref:N-acetylglucosamine kinase n=1 Tax=Marivirga tractuosa (strain ATCC 23168 / DSM 4126 / NBRC 15989 / NCIMB 1408 / VKM B-1430 / H-43) TaxID=643867 RepID=E4TU37_MARTH|nr:N-acetylglucosamine kinase [Marivirga tractuosa]ADR23059.1 N-acetylglucosamine kinase [Marivirga tractuosa DSM 4126]BDD16267.1 ATPase [Marivirga tractuosa]